MDTTTWILAGLLVGAVVFLMMRSGGDISGEEAAELVRNGATLVDVRTPGEFDDASIQGAINVPLQILAQRLNKLGDKSEPVVLYCRSGARSSQAKSILEGAGFTQVRNMGAMSNWPTR